MSDAIPSIDVLVERDDAGRIAHVRVRFGPHFLAEVSEAAGSVTFQLVATHHGFRADASAVGGELEQLIEGVRERRPDLAID